MVDTEETVDSNNKTANDENDDSISLKTENEEEDNDEEEETEDNKTDIETGSKKTSKTKKSASDDPRITRYRKFLKLAGLRIVSNKELDALKSNKVR